MEDINKKANEDELNKAHEEIGKTPRKFIPVPKTKKDKKDEEEPTPSKSRKGGES